MNSVEEHLLNELEHKNIKIEGLKNGVKIQQERIERYEKALKVIKDNIASIEYAKYIATSALNGKTL